MKVPRPFFPLVLVLAVLLPAQAPERPYGWPLFIHDGVSSGFGEFRANHFHAGIDLRTLQHTGFPVRAIADGWIERLSVSNRGYGRLLRLRHRDGNYSLYGHLQRFRGDIEAIVERVRAQGGKRYFSDLDLPNPPAVRRGDVIAFSGESGAGFAHLHLEVRDGEGRSLNPLRLIDDLQRDVLAPLPLGVLLRSRNGSLVNGDCGEFYFKLHREGQAYTLPRPLELSGACDVVLQAVDLSDVGHVIPPFALAAGLDGRPVYAVAFERLTRDDNNQLGMLYDMAHSTASTFFFNLCSQKGFVLERSGGRLADELACLTPGLHEIRVVLADQAGNQTPVVLPLLKVAPVASRAPWALAEPFRGGSGVMQGLEFVPFVNGDDITIKVKEFPVPAGSVKLRIGQGQAERMVVATACTDGVCFTFKPLNHELRLRLSFERSENGMLVEVRQKTLQAVLLENGLPQTVRWKDFSAEFGPTTVQEPTVLLLEEVALQPDLPLLAGPVRSYPGHFAFLDAVHFRFRIPPGAPRPEQLGIYRYSPQSRSWAYIPSRFDQEPGFVSARVLTAGTFALLRDIFPPAVSLRRLGSRRLGRLKQLFVRLSDRGEGINDAAIEVLLNGLRLEGDFDPDWSHFSLENLPGLRKGPNVLMVRAADLAGNRVEKRFVFSLK
jgi:hypothetical protein